MDFPIGLSNTHRNQWYTYSSGSRPALVEQFSKRFDWNQKSSCRSILKVEGFGTHRSVIIFIKQTQRKIQTQHTNTYTNTNTKKKYKHKHKYKYRFKHEKRFKLNWNHISLIFHFLLFVVLEVLLMRKIDEQEFPGICTNEQNIGWNNVHSAVVLLKWAPVFINSFPAVNDLVNQNLTWV